MSCIILSVSNQLVTKALRINDIWDIWQSGAESLLLLLQHRLGQRKVQKNMLSGRDRIPLLAYQRYTVFSVEYSFLSSQWFISPTAYMVMSLNCRCLLAALVFNFNVLLTRNVFINDIKSTFCHNQPLSLTLLLRKHLLLCFLRTIFPLTNKSPYS